MWVARFTFDASKALIGGLAVKHKISLFLYPFYVQHCGDHTRVSFFILFQQDGMNSFVRDLKKNERLVFCNHKDRLLIGQEIEPVKYSILYGPDIIHLKPWFVDGEKGTETFIVGSRKRKYLQHIADVIKEKHLGRMDYVRWKDVSEFFMLNIIPKITLKQRRAIELAISKGYYERPRKTTLASLAKMMKVSYPTYQIHLTKAERKILPTLYSELY